VQVHVEIVSMGFKLPIACRLGKFLHPADQTIVDRIQIAITKTSDIRDIRD